MLLLTIFTLPYFSLITSNRQLSGSTALPTEIANDNDIMQYAIKGSNEQWQDALEMQKVDSKGTIQIRSQGEGSIMKRKLNDDDIEKEVSNQSSSRKDKSSNKKKKRSKKNK